MAKDNLQKQFVKLLSTAKSFNDDEMLVTGVLGSDASTDRHGDRINPKGWNLENFKKNPVILLNHAYDALPIGKAVNVKRKADGLVFDIQFSKAYDVAKTAYALLKEGILNAWSVGFIPLEFGKSGGEYTIDKMELLELSLVTVPANPNALTPRQMKSLQTLEKGLEPTTEKEEKAENELVSEEVVLEEETKDTSSESRVGESGGEVKPEEKPEEVVNIDESKKDEEKGEEIESVGEIKPMDSEEVMPEQTEEADEEKEVTKLLQSSKVKEMIAEMVKVEVAKAFETKAIETTKSVESDEVESTDPKTLLLTAISEQLKESNAETGKTLRAFNKLLSTIQQ